MRWFAKPFSEIEYTKAGAVAGETVKTSKTGCKTTTGSQRGDNGDDDDARGDASKRQRTGPFSTAVNARMRASGEQNSASSKGGTKRKASGGHNHTE